MLLRIFSILVGSISLSVVHSFTTERSFHQYSKESIYLPRHVLGSTTEKGNIGQEQSETPVREGALRYRQPHSRDKEYWLDLRDTAVLPIEALQFLDQNIFGEGDTLKVNAHSREQKRELRILSYIDKILLSEDSFQKALGTNVCRELPLLYTPAGDEILIANNNELRQSFQMGRITLCETNVVVDPLMAMEITGDGGWLLIDSLTNEMEETNWLENQVSSLLGFLLSMTQVSETVNGLLLHTTSVGSSSQGGVAVACKCKRAFLQMCVALEQSLGASMITTSTESGIVLPTGMPGKPGDKDRLNTALVLPFDVMLWETAVDMQELETDQF